MLVLNEFLYIFLSFLVCLLCYIVCFVIMAKTDAFGNLLAMVFMILACCFTFNNFDFMTQTHTENISNVNIEKEVVDIKEITTQYVKTEKKQYYIEDINIYKDIDRETPYMEREIKTYDLELIKNVLGVHLKNTTYHLYVDEYDYLKLDGNNLIYREGA